MKCFARVSLITALAIIVSACSAPSAEPTVNPQDIQSAVVTAAFTIVAETQAVIPTNTPVLPTDTLIPTPAPTDTPTPSLIPDSANSSPTVIPTYTSSSNGDLCNQPLTSWQGPSANINIVNETNPKGDLTVSLFVVTELGECGYLYVTGDSLTGPAGQYSARAFVNGKQDFKVSGGFRITEGAWRIIVKNKFVTAKGNCYPDC